MGKIHQVYIVLWVNRKDPSCIHDEVFHISLVPRLAIQGTFPSNPFISPNEVLVYLLLNEVGLHSILNLLQMAVKCSLKSEPLNDASKHCSANSCSFQFKDSVEPAWYSFTTGRISSTSIYL